jgi:hypothetical protein
MTTKVIAVTLAFTVLGGTLALARDAKLQIGNGANVGATNLDRCPYYPSPVFCRDNSRAHEQDEMDHNAAGR